MRYGMLVCLAAAGVCSVARGRDAKEPQTRREFLLGGDISMLARIEQLGGVFREGGRRKDLIALLAARGCNCFRLRLFVSPNHRGAVVNDLAYTVALARRVKASGAKLLLDLHYSDTWADPGHQTQPAAWRDLDFPSLEKKVADYSAAVITELKKHGALPDIVQPGNEITPGFLWPDGKLGGEGEPTKRWARFTRLLRAGIAGVERAAGPRERPKIMIHIDRGGSWGVSRWFFSHLGKWNVRFDLIGLSYYPFLHGSMADLRHNLRRTAETFRKDIVVVETAYPYRDAQRWRKHKMPWPVSPAGQKAFLADLIRTVRQTPGGRGAGVLWWYPESILVPGLRVWHGGTTALFDETGSALPAVNAFRPAPVGR